jgi:hypothetical protein
MKKQVGSQSKFWVLFTNVTTKKKEERLAAMRTFGQEELQFEAKGASCYLFRRLP